MTMLPGRPSFGVELHEYLDAPTVLHEVELAERLGYAAVWLGDSQLIWREPYTLLGAAAVRTTRVALGTGVTNPLTRHVAVTASALVTLQELSGGRILAGVGIGDSAVHTLGVRPASLAALEAFVATLRPLAGGSSVSTATAEIRLVFGAPGQCPPVIVAASGPRMLHLAGEIGDGVIVTRQAQPGETLSAMLKCVNDGRAARGDADAPFRTCLSAPVAVDADRRRAFHAVRPHVASTLRARLHWELSDAASEAREQIIAAYDFYQHMNPAALHADLVPDEVVIQFAIAGTPEECIAQSVSLFEAGIDEITTRPYGIDGASRATSMELFARQVMEPAIERFWQAGTGQPQTHDKSRTITGGVDGL